MIRRVLVDIDILLDILLDREPFVEDSVKLWELIESEQIEGYVTPTTINKIFDIGRESVEVEIAWQAVSDIRAIMKICPIDDTILEKASKYKLSDFEFSIQLACANILKIDYILTRKVANFKLFFHPDFKYISEYIFSLLSVKRFLEYLLSEKQFQYWVRYFHEEEKCLKIVQRITNNASNIVANSVRALCVEEPQLISQNASAYIDSQIVVFQRDMENILRYIMYAMLARDTSVLEKLKLMPNSLCESLQSQGIPYKSVIFAIHNMKEDVIKIVKESTGNTPIDYINLIDELTSYFDQVIALLVA
ncbi:PIN domain-containing protein [Nostoc sp.]|uniref:PIN domain-containing protein n=2 Tax=Nostoc sp. TaxID=1180 RepID=UPI002FF656B0